MAARRVLAAAALVLLAVAAAPQVRWRCSWADDALQPVWCSRNTPEYQPTLQSLQTAAAAAGVAELEARAGQLRAALAAQPSSFEAALELASTLHQLDHSAPNGGKRVPEAAAAYRRAAELAPQAAARAAVLSNLAALLLAGGRVRGAGGGAHFLLRLDFLVGGTATHAAEITRQCEQPRHDFRAQRHRRSSALQSNSCIVVHPLGRRQRQEM